MRRPSPLEYPKLTLQSLQVVSFSLNHSTSVPDISMTVLDRMRRFPATHVDGDPVVVDS